jgi:hypothetical protein
MATAAGKKQQKKAPGSPKISNNFKPVGSRNLPRLAKAGGGVSKPEAAGSTPKKRPQEGTPRKKPRGEGTFVFRVDHKRARAAKIAMVDATHVDLPVVVRGTKCKYAGNLANPKSRPATVPVDEGGSNEENPKIARGKISAYGQVGKWHWRETASTTMGPAPNLRHERNMARCNAGNKDSLTLARMPV